MFIIGKKEDKVDEGLRNCLGANNINIIYDYFDSYYSVMHQQDEINDCKRQYNNASNRYYNACFTCWGALGFLLNYPKYNNLGREMDRTNDALRKSEDDFLLMEGNLNKSYQRFLDSDILVRMEGARNYYSTVASEPTSEDLLKDLILNNELDLIEDHFIDKLEYDVDKRISKKHKKDNYHNYELFEERLYNVALQNQLLKKTIENHYDADVVYDVIDTCYSALQRRDTALNTARYDYLNDDIQEYIDETKKGIHITKHNKTKRR